jgi:hypothetical protein
VDYDQTSRQITSVTCGFPPSGKAKAVLGSKHRAAVDAWFNGGNWQLVAEHVEVESGKRDDNRPALAAAIAACRAFNAKLVIAKLENG